MKHLALIATAALLLFAACRSESTPIESAAMELYRGYADNDKGITVAYIGDYSAYDQVFNAVMFRADDSTQWQWLKQEFGVIEPTDLDSTAAAKEGATMISIHIDTSIHFHSKEEQQAYIDSITQQIVNQIAGQSAEGKGSLEVASILASDTSLDQQLQNRLDQQGKLVKYNRKNDKVDYLLSVDFDNRTVLCFFCRTQEEATTLARWLNRGKIV